MKKILAIVAIVAMTASIAVAYPGYKGGQNCGDCGPGKGKAGMMKGKGKRGDCIQQQGDPIDDAGAKAKVQEWIDSNLKGAEVVDSIKMEGRRGLNMYVFKVKDASDNLFGFKVSPYGKVMGPKPIKALN